MIQGSLINSSKVLKEILGLERDPVAVKFFKENTALTGFVIPSERRYCQFLMDSSQGDALILTAENISCPAAAWAFGLKKPPAKLKSGEMPAGMGIFDSPEAAKNTLASMSRLKMGKYKMVAVCPLASAPFAPDVIVVESSPEQLMWLALSRVFNKGGRLHFSTAILQATCVDVTVMPFLTQTMNASLGCYGCREATNLSMNECVLGFPVKDLDLIVDSLKKLNERVIPRVRSKPVYKALLSR
jgi:uncharacterized protein (DUF169 family)